MTGDYTKVPLRRDERWTGARMQQGRVLLDHDWNLNLDAAARAARQLRRDAIGCRRRRRRQRRVRDRRHAERHARPHARRRAHVGRRPRRLRARAVHLRLDQDQIPALPAARRVFVYLDVFEEHVQPAEDPLELVDPALAPDRHDRADPRRLPRPRRADHGRRRAPPPGPALDHGRGVRPAS